MNYRNFFTSFLWKLGLFDLACNTFMKHAKCVLMFHGIANQDYPELHKEAQPSLTISALDKILYWVEKRFDYLTPEEFLTTKKPGVLLTFDDGLASNYDNGLQVLRKHNAPAIYFVTTQHIIDPLNWLPACQKAARMQWENLQAVPDEIAQDFYNGMTENQVKNCALDPLITIGCHSISHPFLTECTPACLNEEILGSKQYLEKLTRKPVEFFAYPTGDYNHAVGAKVIQAGYKAAFAVKRLGKTSLQYEIPRIGLYQSDDAYLSMKLSGLYMRPIRPQALIK